MDDIDFILQVYAELLPVARMFGAIIDVRLAAAASGYAPESLDVWLTVTHARTGNSYTARVEPDDWRAATREAKRLLNEWRISGRREPTPFVPVM